MRLGLDGPCLSRLWRGRASAQHSDTCLNIYLPSICFFYRCSNGAERRDLAEAIKELKQAIVSNSRSIDESHRPVSAPAFTSYSARGNGLYDDGGFGSYAGNGVAPPVVSRPSEGWLGTARTPVHSFASMVPEEPVSSVLNATGNRHGVGHKHADGRHSSPVAASFSPPLANKGDSSVPSNSDTAAYPQSFHEVMEMVAKGITPPNVRVGSPHLSISSVRLRFASSHALPSRQTDINDKPPDPTRPPSEPRSKPIPKPWEKPATSGQATVSVKDDDEPSSPLSPFTVSSSTARAAGEGSPFLAPPPQQQVAATSLSLLQPLLQSGATWKPPAIPDPSITPPSVTASRSSAGPVQVEASEEAMCTSDES